MDANVFISALRSRRGPSFRNKKDFAEAKSFGLELLTPKEFLARIGELR